MINAILRVQIVVLFNIM